MKKTNRFYQLPFLIVLIAVFLICSVCPVHASSGGQQIKVTACSAVRVIIKGTNLSGASVTYTLEKTASNCDPVKIPDYFWSGTVKAIAYYNVSSEYPYYKGLSVSAVISTPAQSTDYFVVKIPTPSTRNWILWRAQTWVTDHVAYNQKSTHDGYRQDCSGYVSFVWQLKKPGASPSGISSYSYKIPFDSLKPGDALNNPSSHTMLFMQWVDQSKGTFIAFEEENAASGTRQRTLTLNKSTGVISQGVYYTYPGNYKAMRLTGL
jgi:hypothetical protein